MKNKKLCDYSIATIVFTIFTDFDLTLAAISFLKTVFFDFFVVQFSRKFGLSKTPIARVDNELDNKIPFTPSKVGIYLDFSGFWIRPLSMLVKKLGRKEAKPYVYDFLRKITKAYSTAGHVYQTCLTTTNRPHYKKNFYFQMIHIFDPHYMCVPSLHITVVALVWNFYKDAFKKIKLISEEEKKLFIDEIYSGTIQIAESVLYIKQHSVNCIPAALYMMSRIMHPYFNANDAIKFLHDMFKGTDIPQEDQKEIKDYMEFIFERFFLPGISAENWIEPIIAWLKIYCINSNQAYIAKKIR